MLQLVASLIHESFVGLDVGKQLVVPLNPDLPRLAGRGRPRAKAEPEVRQFGTQKPSLWLARYCT